MLEQQNSFPLIYQAASHPHIYILYKSCYENTSSFQVELSCPTLLYIPNGSL